MSCGELGPIEGGLIKNSTIQDSTLTNCDISGGKITGTVLDSCTLKDLAECDESSARTIAGAIADDATAIRTIADGLAGDDTAIRTIADGIADDETAATAIAEAIAGQNPASFANPAAATATSELPTYMYGSRDAILGKPAAWMQVGDYVIPVYAKAGA